MGALIEICIPSGLVVSGIGQQICLSPASGCSPYPCSPGSPGWIGGGLCRPACVPPPNQIIPFSISIPPSGLVDIGTSQTISYSYCRGCGIYAKKAWRNTVNLRLDTNDLLSRLKTKMESLGYDPSLYKILTTKFSGATEENFFNKLGELSIGDSDIKYSPISNIVTILKNEAIDSNFYADNFIDENWERVKNNLVLPGNGDIHWSIDKQNQLEEGSTDTFDLTEQIHAADEICFYIYLPSEVTVSDYRHNDEDSSGDPTKEDGQLDQDVSDDGSVSFGGASSPDGGRTTEKVSSYSPTTEWSQVQDFDNLYIPVGVAIADIPGIVIGEDKYYYEATGITISEIKNSLVEPDIMTFIEPSKYDVTPKFNIGEKVFGILHGESKFIGYVKSIERVLSADEQYIRYTAVGLRARLYEIGFAFEFKFTDISLKTAFEYICSKIPSVIVNQYDASKLPITVIPELNLGTCTFGKALDTLLDKAGHYGFYIDCSKKLTVYDLESLTTKDLRIPSEGEAIGTHKVISKNLNLDVSQCKTRCIIQGDYPLVEIEQYVRYTKSGDFYYLQLKPNIIRNLLSDTSNDFVIKSHIGDNQSLAPIFIDSTTGKVKCIVKSGFSSGTEWRNIRSDVYVRYVYKEVNPIKIDTGWVGTAYTSYNIQSLIIKHETRFKKISGVGVESRDDTVRMQEYANQLLNPVKDAKYGGTILLDGLLSDYDISKCVNFTNTGEDWSNVKLVIYSVTYRIDDNSTSLELSNTYYVGSGIIDTRLEDKKEERDDITSFEEIKQIVLDLEKRV